VDDAVEALLLAAASPQARGQVFNLGGDCVVSLQQLADALVEINGAGNYLLRDFPADRKRIDVGDYYADYSRIQATLGWRPQVSLREGLERTLAFYRQHLPHYR
jgi:UDP-glucose 4-epimerase